MFKKATKQDIFLKCALMGPAGSGKTYTALKIAKALVDVSGGEIAAIDTERGSMKKYSDLFTFDVVEFDNYAIQNYIKAIQVAEKEGYKVLIIDSLSHAWAGKGGALEMVEVIMSRMKTHNSFVAWKEITPLQNQLIDAIIGAKMHIVVTLRTKTEYVIETTEKGKAIPRKIGTAPVQRDGVEYEFDIIGDMTPENDLIITKTRCSELTGRVFNKPDKEFTDIIVNWIGANKANTKENTDEIRIKKSAPKPDKTPVKEDKQEQEPDTKENEEFLTEQEGREIWEIAKKNGYNVKEAKEILSALQIESFHKIPVLMKKQLTDLFSNPKEAL